MKKSLTLFVVALMSASMWAENPSWLRPGDEWNDATKTLTVKSDLVSSAYAENNEILHVIISDGVTSIGTRAFYYCTALTSVVIPNTVTSIGDWAFYCCYINLTSIDIPNSVESIGDKAFAYCYALTSVTIGNGVTSIGESAFYECKALNSLTIGSSVKSIGNQAFMLCSAIPSVVIPNSVETIGKQAFYYCSAISSLTIGNSVQSIGYGTFYKCSALTSVEIPNSVKAIGEYAFYDCPKIASLTIGNSVTSIGNFAFFECKALTSVEIPNSVVSIGSLAFSGCTKIASATIGSGITSIADNAFSGCSVLTEVTCEAVNPPAIGTEELAFYGCPALEHIYVPEKSVKAYKEDEYWQVYFSKISAIHKCGENLTWDLADGVLTISGTGEMTDYPYPDIVPWDADKSTIHTVVINDGVTSIGERAFISCSNISSVTFPNSLTFIGPAAFAYCKKLLSVTILGSVKTIGDYAFKYSGLASAVVPKTVENLEFEVYAACPDLPAIIVDAENPNYSDIDGVLCNKNQTILMQYPRGKSATKYTIPGTVTEIEAYAFDECSGLTSVTIPGSVTKIGNRAFYYCVGLTSVTCEAVAPPTWEGDDIFYHATNLAHIYVPKTSVDDYKGATGWKDYASIIEAISDGTGIDQVSDQITNDQSLTTTKLLRDGQLLILRDSHTYTLTGQEVR